MSDPNKADEPNRSPLDDEAKSRIERTVRRFRQALEATVDQERPANISDYLPREAGPLRLAMLEQLIACDLEVRYARGQKPVVEDYLLRFDEIPQEPKTPIGLLVAEYNARKLTGEDVSQDEFKRRFPKVFDRFVKALSSHEYRTMDSGSYSASPNSRESYRSQGFQGTASQFGAAGYQLVRKIGEGSYGEVWSAEAPGGVDVAIKMVNRPLTDDGYRREHEALELVKRLRHPFLLQTHAFWSEQDRLIVATELADCSLRDRLKECEAEKKVGIPLVELMGYMRESAEALDFLGSKDILHRDVKPENILIVNGHAKVADFGVARAVPKDGGVATQIDRAGKQSQLQATIIGTPHFMSPEVWQSSFSKNLDQYSLAIAYVQLRTGKSPFAGDSLNALMFGHMTQAPKLEGLPEKEKVVALKALSKNPTDRYVSNVAFVEAMERAAGLRKDKLLRWPLIVAAGLLALVAIGLIGNWWLHRWDYQVTLPEEIHVAAGDTANVQLGIGGNPPAADANVVVDDLPEGVVAADTKVAAGAKETGLRFAVSNPNLVGIKSISKDVRVRVERAGLTQTRTLRLIVDPPQFVGSEYLEPMDGAKFERVGSGNRIYCNVTRIKDLQKVGGEIVIFRLVPSKAEKPFYMMETKVWNGLFGQFAKAKPEAVKNSEWTKGPKAIKTDKSPKPIKVDLGIVNLKWPVFRVRIFEAIEFAEWLIPHGQLPTRDQWIAAAMAGSENASDRIGPYDPRWDRSAKDASNQIGIKRMTAGPLEAGAGSADVTPLGFRDMAGNGKEWTREGRLGRATQGVPFNFEVNRNTKFKLEDKVVLVGRSYNHSEPLPFTEVREPLNGNGEIPDSDTGFRVVFDPDR